MTSISAARHTSMVLNDKEAETANGMVLVSADHIDLPTEDGMVSETSMSVVIQDSGEASDAIETALYEAGVEDPRDIGEIAVVEIPPPNGSDDDASLFVVLWGRAVHALTWIDALPSTMTTLPDVKVSETSALRPEVMAGVLATGNMAFGVCADQQVYPYYSLTRWLAVASPCRAAWDALDRFFLGMNHKK